MSVLQSFQGKLVRRYLVLFIALGLLPSIGATLIPLIYHLKHEEMASSYYLEAVILVSLVFLAVIIIGGWITFSGLALPLQELAKGARNIARGDFSYRIPDLGRDDEISELGDTFNAMAVAITEKHNECLMQQSTLQTMLNQRAAEFNVIARIAGLINTPPDLTGHLSYAMELARESLGPDYLAIFLRNQEGDFIYTASSCDEETEEAFQQHCKKLVDLPLFELAINSQEPVRILDINTSSIPLTLEQKTAYSKLKVRRLAIKQIKAQDEVLGVLLLMRHESYFIPQETISFMETLTDHIANFIQNSRLRTQLRDLTIIEERRRLANDLHDSVTQSLYSLGMAAESLKNSLGNDPDSTQLALEVISSQTATIQSELRSLINELRPLDLDNEEGLDWALKKHIRSMKLTTNVQVNLQIRGDTRSLPKHIQQTLNRITQEALSNIARHAQASRVDIDLFIDTDTVTLTISDNGVGFEPIRMADISPVSFGLESMRNRVELAGGGFEVNSSIGRGTQIRACLPLPKKK